MNEDIERTLYTEAEIQAAAKRIGTAISQDCEDRVPVLISVLKGALLWTSDVVRHITGDAEIEFISISSYHGGLGSSNEIDLNADLIENVKNRDVIIIEDIVDSGQSLRFLVDKLNEKGVKSVKVCAMLNKLEGRLVDVPDVDYAGFEIPNEFVVGYGLDYKELYRNLPYVGILKPSVYN